MKNEDSLDKNAFFLIAQILEEMGVGKEDDDEIEYFSATAVINNLAEKLYDKNISENDFLLSLKFLNTTDENYKKILSKVKMEVFPLLKSEEFNTSTESESEIKVKTEEENIVIPKIIESGEKNTNSSDAYREPI